MHTIENSIEVSAPAEALVTAIATRAGLRAWFVDDTRIDDSGRYTFTFANPEETRVVTFTLDRVGPNGVDMTCVAEHNNPDWLGTRLAITVTPRANGKTRVDLAHSGYPSKNEVYARCTEGWAHFLSSLAKYATTGRGEPFRATVAAQEVVS